MMMLVNSALSALLQLTVLGGIPFLGYFVYQKWQMKTRVAKEILRRTGLWGCEWRYVLYAVGLSLLGVILLIVWSPDLEPLTREGSAQRRLSDLVSLNRGSLWRFSTV